jgi:hypothetical protein
MKKTDAFRKLQLLSFSALSLVSEVHAQANYYYNDEPAGPTTTHHMYKLLTGGFGSFIIVFMGLGGMATLFITRRQGSQRQTPILGVLMVLVAIGMFAYRMAINSGVMGHEYIEW